jgi:hypothetical protein
VVNKLKLKYLAKKESVYQRLKMKYLRKFSVKHYTARQNRVIEFRKARNPS